MHPIATPVFPAKAGIQKYNSSTNQQEQVYSPLMVSLSNHYPSAVILNPTIDSPACFDGLRTNCFGAVTQAG